jgi:hypothetical protein
VRLMAAAERHETLAYDQATAISLEGINQYAVCAPCTRRAAGRKEALSRGKKIRRTVGPGGRRALLECFATCRR